MQLQLHFYNTRVGKAQRAHECAVIHPVGTRCFAHPTKMKLFVHIAFWRVSAKFKIVSDVSTTHQDKPLPP
jgi:hypothetical protein